MQSKKFICMFIVASFFICLCKRKTPSFMGKKKKKRRGKFQLNDRPYLAICITLMTILKLSIYKNNTIKNTETENEN